MHKYIISTLTAITSALSVTADPPSPPKGFNWIENPVFTDEFNGTSLDASKWHDHHPRWKGRAPAKFVHEAVSVNDGMMQIQNRMLDKPEGSYTIGGGAVVSKSEDAFYGYYECRMKASGISMSSTFWMSNRGKKTKDGKVALELDIQETIDGPKKVADKNMTMNWNTHFWVNGKSHAAGGKAPTHPQTNEDFHTYGAWWVDANTVHFYLNNEHVGTTEFSTEYSATPFNFPMHINMVTETYDWETPPTPDEVNNPDINTTYYDWVRAYTLMPANGSLPDWQVERLYNEPRNWKAADGKSTTTATLVKAKYGYAHLEKKNGTIIKIPIKLLSPQDRELLSQIIKSN